MKYKKKSEDTKTPWSYFKECDIKSCGIKKHLRKNAFSSQMECHMELLMRNLNLIEMLMVETNKHLIKY